MPRIRGNSPPLRLAQASLLDQLHIGCILRLDLLLIDRRHDHCRGAGIFQPADAVELARQRRGRGDDRVGERQAEIFRGQFHAAPHALSQFGRNLLPSRAAKVLIDAIALVDGGLGLAHHLGGGLAVAMGEHGVAQLVIGEIFQLQPRPRRVEAERVAAALPERGIVAEQRPVAGGRGAGLLLHAKAQIVAVGDAVRIGQHQRRARIGLGLAQRTSACSAFAPMAICAT